MKACRIQTRFPVCTQVVLAIVTTIDEVSTRANAAMLRISGEFLGVDVKTGIQRPPFTCSCFTTTWVYLT